MVRVMYFIITGKKILAAVLCCTLLIGASIVAANLSGSKAIHTASASTNWGLSFRQPGTAPEGNASSDYLQKYDAYYIGSSNKKTIYLTFDAGFENGYTPSILDTLQKHNVKAAFFLVGNYMESSPELVKRMCNEGHIVGNHTYHHPDMSKIADKDGFQKELQSFESLYKQITGKDMPKYYRPPQGKYSESNLKMAKELGYHTFFWSLAYVDWYTDNQPTRDEAFKKLLLRIHPGAIVLLHSTSRTNAEILDELLTKWKSEGYGFGTLNELIQ